MVVEITGTDGNYLDSIVVEDIDEIVAFLDQFVGSDALAVPSTLEYLTSTGEVSGVEIILWGIQNGRPTSWRSVQAA